MTEHRAKNRAIKRRQALICLLQAQVIKIRRIPRNNPRSNPLGGQKAFVAAAQKYVQCNCENDGEDSAESESPEHRDVPRQKAYRCWSFAGSEVSVSSVMGASTPSAVMSSSGIEVSDMDHCSFGSGSDPGGASTPGVRVVSDGKKPSFHTCWEAWCRIWVVFS